MGKNFVVLGMHRSATSLVSKALADQGLTCRNEHDVRDENNPSGYWEDAMVLQLNDQILAAAGGDWLDPPPAAAVSEQAEWARPEIAALMAERYSEDGWVLKEPRLVLTFPLWLPEFDSRSAEVVFVYRDRRQIIASLMRRQDPSASQVFAEERFGACVDEHLSRLAGIAGALYTRKPDCVGSHNMQIEFTVQGETRVEIEEAARKTVGTFLGVEDDSRAALRFQVRPVLMMGGGDIALWEATVIADI